MTRYEKIAQMKPEQKNHWIDMRELSAWGERIFAEIAVCEEINKHENGRYDALIDQAVDCLFETFTAEHALPDSVCQKAESILFPFSDTAKSLTMHCVAHAHIDMDWMWGFHETVDVALNTFRTMLDLMDEYHDFTFSQSQAAVYRIAEYYDPELFARMSKRIKEGRFEFAGSTFVELDKNMPNLESMARHILYTKRYLNERFGIPFAQINMDFHPDSFGHSACVPEILSEGGIRYFYHCRGLDGEQLYRWQSDSGAEILALNEPLWYNDSILPMYLHIVPQFCYKYGVLDMMKIYGVGDHGGGPTRKDIEMILEMQKWPLAPTIRFSTYDAFFRSIEPFASNFPVRRGELGPTFTGCYTSQSQMKLINRIGEDRLYEAEMISTFANAKANGTSFNKQYRDAWEKVLFNQFHDILPGSNTPESRNHAMGAFEEAMGAVMAGSGSSLRAFAANIDTSMFETPFDPLTSRSEGGGVGLNTDEKSRFRLPGTERGRGKTRLLHVFNPTRFDRDSVVEATLWDWPGDPDRIKATDQEGNVLDCRVVKQQPNDWNHLRTDILVHAHVPAFGYATIKIEEAVKEAFCFAAMPPDPRVTYYYNNILENDLVRITFDDHDFSVISYFDKVSGQELLKTPAHFVLAHELTSSVFAGHGSAWVEGVHSRIENLHQTSIVTVSTQDISSSLCKQLAFRLKKGDMTIDVTAQLFDHSPILDLSVCVAHLPIATPDGIPQLSFCAPLAYSSKAVRCDMQIGTLDRPLNMTHDGFTRNFCFGVPQQGTRGLSLLSDSKYGCRGDEHSLNISLLRASSGPDKYPEIGERRFRIGLSACDDAPMALKELGEQFAHRDLPYVSNTAHTGTLPLTDRFFTVNGDVTVSCVKQAEYADDAFVIRLASVYNDRPVDASICFTADVTTVEAVDLAEQPISSDVTLNDHTASVSLKPGQSVTLLVRR
ncbi:hypothetical protein H6A12_00345 [Phocea massiliensis]|uniref:Glycoside hydrolase family 38 central domain-containing protein n=1 Tax=Merdimmobilis hominis TaxID=2897707 RepID=A0A938X4Z0_9FIRM|nr:alpha-mannosidase [Merdimmobilis hominis]MBM6919619.1 hypothetical protein [Merdimmobilis hominis]